MVSARLEACTAAADPATNQAKRAFEWFLGRSDLELALYDYGNGGCSNGLHPDRVNENLDAESSVSFHFHLSLAEMNYSELLSNPVILHL